jgi:diketogulonate reductase-like aldo/keto reductase
MDMAIHLGGDGAKRARLPLANGTTIPLLGFGTWQMWDAAEAEASVAEALRLGYRHLDTAALYRNEAAVGKAVRASGVPREEVFVTTKLWLTDFLDPAGAFERSLARLDIGYVDLYLVHWPAPLMPKSIWRALEEIYASGKARAIGVSNYGIREIEKTLAYATVAPMINQVRFHPGHADLELLAYCKAHGIVVEAYSPLGRGRLVSNATVQEIAKAHGKTPAQVLIRFALEHGTVPLPKSSTSARIKENLDVFDFSLSPAEVERLNTLG